MFQKGVAPYNSRLWPVMQQMWSDLERVERWIAEAQLPPVAVQTQAAFEGAVPNVRSQSLVDQANVMEGKRDRRQAVPRSDVQFYNRPEEEFEDLTTGAVQEEEEESEDVFADETFTSEEESELHRLGDEPF